MKQAIDLLREHLSKTISLTEEEFIYFSSHFKLHSLKKGQALISEGDTVEHEYFVIKGCLKAFYITQDIKMYILQFAMPTWWTSDFEALYTHSSAKINVDCITDAEVLSLSNTDREKLCREIHQVEHFFRWRTNKGYVAAHNRLLSMMNNNVKIRYEELLRQYPQLYNLVPKHLIAAYLGVSRETLSRLYSAHTNVI